MKVLKSDRNECGAFMKIHKRTFLIMSVSAVVLGLLIWGGAFFYFGGMVKANKIHVIGAFVSIASTTVGKICLSLLSNSLSSDSDYFHGLEMIPIFFMLLAILSAMGMFINLIY